MTASISKLALSSNIAHDETAKNKDLFETSAVHQLSYTYVLDLMRDNFLCEGSRIDVQTIIVVK